MKPFIKLLMSAFDEDPPLDKLCIRRIAGFLGFGAFIVFIALGINHTAIDLLAILSASLMGLTTIDKFKNKKEGL